MTVVRVPVHVRLQIAADRLDDPRVPALVAELTRAATARAADRARTVQLAALSSVPQDGIEPRVDLRFTGDELPGRTRTEIEGALRAQIAVSAARLLAGRTGGWAARACVSREPLDGLRFVADRRRPEGMAYLVPFYDRKGQHVPVEARGQLTPAPEVTRMRLRMRIFASPEELWNAVLVWFEGAPPRRLVVISGDSTGFPEMCLLELTPDGLLGGRRLLGRVSEWEPAVGTGSATAVGRVAYKADTLHFLRRVTTPREREDVRAQLLLEYFRSHLPANAKVTEDELLAFARGRARQIPSEPLPSQYFELLSESVRVQVIETRATSLLPEEDLPVVVFTETVTLAGEDAETGGYGNCPSLETTSLADWLAAFGLLNPSPRVREEAFLSEPPIESWPPELSAALSALVKDVAGRLHMAPGRFVGSFLIAAMTTIDTRCRRLGDFVSADRQAQLRDMASAFGPVERLTQLYTNAFAASDAAETLPCPLQRRSATWLLHFFEAFGPARDDAVASMFVGMCQHILLEVLVSSHHELSRRAQNFGAYMTVTRMFLVIVLSETTELSDLRDRIVAREQEDVVRATPSGGLPIGLWLSASEALIDLTGLTQRTATTPQRGDVQVRDRRYRVLDGKRRWWTRAELDAVISTGRKEVFAIDPLLQKVSDLPELVHRLQQAQRRDDEASAGTGAAITKAVDEEFAKLLGDLLDENRERTRRVQRDRKIAFGLATFQEAEVSKATDVGARLYGIHKLAGERLRPMFTDDHAYVQGLRQLTYTEIGRAEMLDFFNFVGVAVIAVFCPPAAFLIGAVQAVGALEEALEHKGIQHAMLGGDEIITQAQAEAEMWGAVIGAALAFLPEVPGVVRGVARGTKAVVKGEARETAVAAARAAIRRATVHVAEATAASLTKAFVREIATGYVLNLALTPAIARVTAAVARQVEVTGGASFSDIPDILGQAISGPTSDRDAP